MIAALALVVGIAIGPAVAQTADDLSSPKLRIAWSEFKRLYDEEKVLVVDVRDGGAFAAGHIPNARLIPLDEIEVRAKDLKKQKLPVVTYCS